MGPGPWRRQLGALGPWPWAHGPPWDPMGPPWGPMGPHEAQIWGHFLIMLDIFLIFFKIVPIHVWRAPGGQRGPVGTPGNP